MRVASPILPPRTNAARRCRSRSAGVVRESFQARCPMMATMGTSTANSASEISSAAVNEYQNAAGMWSGSARYRGLLKHLRPVLGELFEALVGERMVEQHIEHLERHGADVGAGERRVHHVHGGAERRRQDLGFVA